MLLHDYTHFVRAKYPGGAASRVCTEKMTAATGLGRGLGYPYRTFRFLDLNLILTEGEIVMCKPLVRRFLAVCLLWVVLVGSVGIARAGDWAQPISNLRAKLGYVTPGDTPGWPITISTPGSYVLTENLQGTGVAMIEITSSFVTLDLNGFIINNGSPGGIPIEAAEGTRNVTVINGMVTGGMGGGIRLYDYSVVDKLVVFAGHGGLRVGNNSKVRDCSVSGAYGIYAEDYSIISNNMAGHGSAGITVGKSSRVNGNQILSASFWDIKTGPNSIIEDNTVVDSMTGIQAGSGSLVSRNTVTGSGTGITADSGSKVTGNTVTDCHQVGLNLAADAGYANNVLTGNNGGSDNPQVAGGIQMGINVCGNGTACP